MQPMPKRDADWNKKAESTVQPVHFYLGSSLQSTQALRDVFLGHYQILSSQIDLSVHSGS